MSNVDDGQHWQALLRVLADRAKDLQEHRFYDRALDRYHPLREQIIGAFNCAHLSPDRYDAIFARVPRLPDIAFLRTHADDVPLDELAVHFGTWFSAERWGVTTAHEVFAAGILTTALDRFTDPNATLPFATFDRTKIDGMTRDIVGADTRNDWPS